MGEVHAVAHHEDRRAAEAREIRLDPGRARHLLVDQHAGPHAARAALLEQRLGEGERSAGIENVVDDDNVPPRDLGLHPAQHLDLAGGNRVRAVAREEDKVDLRLEPLAVKRPDEVGGEDEAALQDRHDDEIDRRRRGDLAAEASTLSAMRSAL